MNTTTVLLIHELVKHFISNEANNTGSIKANIDRIGFQLGERVMMKVSDKHSSKVTRDTPKILQLFATEFWEFVFGKPVIDISAADTSSINFKDPDFELLTRIDGQNMDQVDQFTEYLRSFIISMFKGSLSFMNLNVRITIQKQNQNTLIDVKCID